MAASWCKRSYIFKKFGFKLNRNCLWHRYDIFTRVPRASMLSYYKVSDLHLPIASCCTSSKFSKKDVDGSLDKTHNPATVEDRWYDWWVDQGFFTPNIDQGEKLRDKFVILSPPPNVTGTLHLGHAMTGAIQDAFVRWNRMSGKSTLWIPGLDHAGIATHAVVERKVWKEQRKTRHDLGKEEFVKEIWKLKDRNGEFINNQLRRLGLSFDWSREFFTLSKDISPAVTEAFCHLYEKGLIYQDKRMVNWSCAFKSSVSDIEVDKVKLEQPTKLRIPGEMEDVEFGVISSFGYPVVDSDEELVVSTTRLETMMADTAVAVHPDDPRYSHLVGKRLCHPIIQGKELPVIADSFVDMNFGTGAVKITPGHDPVDFEVSRRHNLEIAEVVMDDGTMDTQLSLVGGMTRFQARRKLRNILEGMELMHGDKDHLTVLHLCSRSGDVIEPRLKTQWFLNCQDMAKKALEAVESNQLSLIPDYNRKLWKEWLEDVQDWCLSRQLWWGHSIPVYTHKESGQTVCARTEVEARLRVASILGQSPDSIQLLQDDDVLDTWFSSALLPFSALGWPNQTHDHQLYFPQQLMETGQDILFFWVARMVMLSLELIGTLPFDKVLLHGMIRDSHGRKMTKSLGNVIDPLDVIDGVSLKDLHQRLEMGNLDPSEVDKAKEGQQRDFPNGITACGADALRFTLCSYNVKNVDINFNVEHAESKRRFCNKVWQSFKFILSHLGQKNNSPLVEFTLTGQESGTDLWILSRLSHMVESCDQHFKSYDLHLVASTLQTFWHQEMCDVYLESVKPVLAGQDAQRQDTVRQILHLCAQTYLRALAPFMPFLCEELFQHLSHHETNSVESVCVAAYPKPDEYPWTNENIETSMKTVGEIISHVQKLRKDYKVMGSKSNAYIRSDDPCVEEWLVQHMDCFLSLSRSGSLTVISGYDPQPPGCTVSHISPDLTVFVQITGRILDLEKELSRLLKKLSKLEDNVEKTKTKLKKLERKGKGHIFEATKLRQNMEKMQTESEDVKEKMVNLKSTQEGR